MWSGVVDEWHANNYWKAKRRNKFRANEFVMDQNERTRKMMSGAHRVMSRPQYGFSTAPRVVHLFVEEWPIECFATSLFQLSISWQISAFPSANALCRIHAAEWVCHEGIDWICSVLHSDAKPRHARSRLPMRHSLRYFISANFLTLNCFITTSNHVFHSYSFSLPLSYSHWFCNLLKTLFQQFVVFNSNKSSCQQTEHSNCTNKC